MLVGSSFSRALREAAPGLSRRFFGCNRPHTFSFGNVRNSSSTSHRSERHVFNGLVRRLSTTKCQSRIVTAKSGLCQPSHFHGGLSFPLRANRGFSISTRARNVTTSAEIGENFKAEHQDGESSHDGTKSRKSFFPDTSSNVVAYWLLGSAASVFGIVVFGGLTRLTESGYVEAPASTL